MMTIAQFLATRPSLAEIDGALAMDGIGQPRMSAEDRQALVRARLEAMRDGK